MGGEQRSLILCTATLERGIDACEHVLGHHIGEEAEATAVDAEQRGAALGDETCGVEQRAIAADRHHQPGLCDQRGLRQELRRHAREALGFLGGCQHDNAARGEVARQHRRAFGGAGIGETGDEGAVADGGHGAP